MINSAMKKNRLSGVDLLRILAILIIVISHVVQTICSENDYISYHDYYVDLSCATTNIQYFSLLLFRYFGALGNTIFFICSAWFLVDSNFFDKKKWLSWFCDEWLISVIILISFMLFSNITIPTKIIIKSIFPSLFENNWYVTCYLLFYPIHIFLNIIIERISQKTLLRVVIPSFFLYYIINFFIGTEGGRFFPSALLLWIVLYFAIAYIKIYMPEFANNIKQNLLLLLIGLTGYLGLAILTNYLGLHIFALKNQMFCWVTNWNPFLVMIAVALLNLARRIKFKNSCVTYISGLTLLIYLIHENLILRTYLRPWIMNYVYVHYGYSHIVSWVLILSLIIFGISILLSIIYDKTIRKYVQSVIKYLYPLIRAFIVRIEDRFLIKD